MVTVAMPFGKYRGRDLAGVPTSYLKWVLNADGLSPWLLRAVQDELDRRGVRTVDAAQVLSDLEEEIAARIADDPFIEHELAGMVSDIVMEATEAVRRRHGIGAWTQMLIPPERSPCQRNPTDHATA